MALGKMWSPMKFESRASAKLTPLGERGTTVLIKTPQSRGFMTLFPPHMGDEKRGLEACAENKGGSPFSADALRSLAAQKALHQKAERGARPGVICFAVPGNNCQGPSRRNGSFVERFFALIVRALVFRPQCACRNIEPSFERRRQIVHLRECVCVMRATALMDGRRQLPLPAGRPLPPLAAVSAVELAAPHRCDAESFNGSPIDLACAKMKRSHLVFIYYTHCTALFHASRVRQKG